MTRHDMTCLTLLLGVEHGGELRLGAAHVLRAVRHWERIAGRLVKVDEKEKQSEKIK